MATQAFDFQLVRLPPIEEARELFGGYLQSLFFSTTVNLAGIGDDIWVTGRVPVDEDWQVLQIAIGDGTAAAGQQGWQMQDILLWFSNARVLASAAVPQPPGPMVVEDQYQVIWSRLWDAVTYVQWGETAGSYADLLTVRPSDPVFSVHRWPAGSLWRVRSFGCQQASGGAKQFQITMIVLRMSKRPMGVEVPGSRAMANAVLHASQATARARALRD